MHSCFTSSIFATRTLDFKVKFGFVFRSEAVVFRRYVLALLSVGLLRKFEPYLVYLSLIRSYFPRCFSFFQKFLHFTYGFALSSPVFPRKLMTCAVVFQLCQLIIAILFKIEMNPARALIGQKVMFYQSVRPGLNRRILHSPNRIANRN